MCAGHAEEIFGMIAECRTSSIRKTNLYRGQGFVHATNRGLEMLLMRTLSQGRLSELLDGSDAACRQRLLPPHELVGRAGNAIGPPQDRGTRSSMPIARGPARHSPIAILRLFGYPARALEAEDAIALSRMVTSRWPSRRPTWSGCSWRSVRGRGSAEAGGRLLPACWKGSTELLRKLTVAARSFAPEVAWPPARPP